MKIVSKENVRLVFVVKMSETLANAVRRYVGRVPTLAIDEVELSKNDSPLYDEAVAHRLGLVPLKVKKVKEEEVELSITHKDKGYVYSSEINGDLEPVYGTIPITYLRENQELKIKATVKSGCGEEHSKFNPGAIFYRLSEEITMDKKFKSQLEAAGVVNPIKDKGNNIVLVDNLDKPILDLCEGVAKQASEKVELKDSGNLVVAVDSFGQLKVEDVFLKSVDALKKDLNLFSKTLK